MKTVLSWLTWTETSPCLTALQANKEVLDQLLLPQCLQWAGLRVLDMGDSQDGGLVRNWILEEQHLHNLLPNSTRNVWRGLCHSLAHTEGTEQTGPGARSVQGLGKL